VVLNDGRELSASVDESKGSPTRPLTPAEVTAKFVANVAPSTGKGRAEQIAGQLVSLSEAVDCFDAVAACCVPAGSTAGAAS
jgi:hypothetical protein